MMNRYRNAMDAVTRSKEEIEMKAQDILNMEQERSAPRKRPAVSRKAIAFGAAAVILAGGTLTVGAVNNWDYAALYRNLMDGDRTTFETIGKTVDDHFEGDGWTIDITNMYADSNSFYMLYDLTLDESHPLYSYLGQDDYNVCAKVQTNFTDSEEYIGSMFSNSGSKSLRVEGNTSHCCFSCNYELCGDDMDVQPQGVHVWSDMLYAESSAVGSLSEEPMHFERDYVLDIADGVTQRTVQGDYTLPCGERMYRITVSPLVMGFQIDAESMYLQHKEYCMMEITANYSDGTSQVIEYDAALSARTQEDGTVEANGIFNFTQPINPVLLESVTINGQTIPVE